MMEWQEMAEFDRITHVPGLMGGRPTIRGMRVTVGMILDQIANGYSIDQILDAYSYLEREDIEQAVRYARRRLDEPDYDLAS
jgi:uncharacterized protein (DUF433 family)